jgi:murein DD-endopeptidase MepM/ murein hydrolase activator NlpD
LRLAAPAWWPPRARRGLSALVRRVARGSAWGAAAAVVLGAGAAGLLAARSAVLRAASRLPTLPALVVSERPPDRWTADTLRASGTLAALFRAQGLPPDALEAAVAALAPHLAPSRLRAGAVLRVRRDAWDSVRAIEFWPDPDRALLLEPGASWSARWFDWGVRAETVGVAGVVQGSLYESAVAWPLGVPRGEWEGWVLPALVEIFRWEIDFFRELRRGDRFRVLVEREVRRDGRVRNARVLAAELVRGDRAHRAVWFAGADSGGAYFDLSGNPVKRAFLRAPLDARRITSRFARSRLHPVLNRWRPHRGVDYAAPPGTPVVAVADGVVTRAAPWGDYGRTVEIRHLAGIRTRYAHLGTIARAAQPGARVRQGQVIGWVGASGLASGPHLHYELWVDGRAVDPARADLPRGAPLPDSLRAAFGRERDRLWLALERAAPRPPGDREDGRSVRALR